MLCHTIAFSRFTLGNIVWNIKDEIVFFSFIYSSPMKIEVIQNEIMDFIYTMYSTYIDINIGDNRMKN